MTDPVYHVVAAFAARLAGLGVTDAVISPGSRSTALALCLDARGDLRTWVQLDERSAGFFALGLGRATGRPAALVCTSGTAAANYLPAVVEASHAGIPMIVCTADRPPELRGWGSPQTIDQVGLYGSAVRWSVDLPVPEDASSDAAAGWAETAVRLASGSDPGPVHLNWPLREPLEPSSEVPAPPAAGAGGTDGDGGREPLPEFAGAVAGATPTRRTSSSATPSPEFAEFADLAELVARHERGVVVVGPWPGGGLHRERRWAGEARRFAARAGWPIIGEPVSHVRGGSRDDSGTDIGEPVSRIRGGFGGGGGADIGEPVSRIRGGFGGGGGADIGEPVSHVRGGSRDDRGTDIGVPVSHVRGGSRDDSRSERPECVVATADHLLACEALAEALRPDVAVLVGRTVTTKPVRLWLERTRPTHVVLIDPEDRWERAVFRLTGHVPASVEALGQIAAGAPPAGRDAAGGWLDTWAQLDAVARSAVDATVDGGPMLSARAARVLAGALPDGAVLVATNSMPVRDLDAFVCDTRSIMCCANRGAAGIDGTASTALGIAATDPSNTVALYTGDLALLHDLGGLAAAARLGLHLTVVCVDNDGGEIFSLLPVAGRVPAGDFERLFRTPHGLDLCGLDGFGGIRARRVANASELDDAVRAAAAARSPGVDLLVVEVPRDDDVAQRRAVTMAAQQAAHQALAAGQALDGR